MKIDSTGALVAVGDERGFLLIETDSDTTTVTFPRWAHSVVIDRLWSGQTPLISGHGSHASIFGIRSKHDGSGSFMQTRNLGESRWVSLFDGTTSGDPGQGQLTMRFMRIRNDDHWHGYYAGYETLGAGSFHAAAGNYWQVQARIYLADSVIKQGKFSSESGDSYLRAVAFP